MRDTVANLGKIVFPNELHCSVLDLAINNNFYFLQVPCSSWFDDMDDRELLDLIPLLEKLSKVDSVYAVLKNKEQVQQHLQQIQSNSGNNQSSLKRSQTSGSSSAATAAVTWWPWAWPPWAWPLRAWPSWAWPPRLPSGPLLQPPYLPRCLPSHRTLFGNLIVHKFYKNSVERLSHWIFLLFQQSILTKT